MNWGKIGKSSKMPPLKNNQHEEFCWRLVYETGWNASEAARRAGYATVGASVTASRLLRVPKVRARAEELQAEKIDTLRAKWRAEHMSPDEVAAENARIARSDLLSFVRFNASGAVLRDSSELTEDEARALKSLTFSYDNNGQPKFKIELHSKDSALDREHRRHGMYMVDPAGDVNVNVLIESRRRELHRVVEDPTLREAARTIEDALLPAKGDTPVDDGDGGGEQ